MRSHIVRIGAFALIASSLAACSDEGRKLLAPKAPNDIILGTPIGPIPLRPTLPSPDDFAEIAASGPNTCARKRNGDVYCWGWLAATPHLYFQGATKIAVGAGHACALNSAGAAYCWGNGDQGQLGTLIHPAGTTGVLPVLGPPADPNHPIDALLPPLTFNAISAAGNSTCGATSSGVY